VSPAASAPLCAEPVLDVPSKAEDRISVIFVSRYISR
jgi:hypothetical protein